MGRDSGRSIDRRTKNGENWKRVKPGKEKLVSQYERGKGKERANGAGYSELLDQGHYWEGERTMEEERKWGNSKRGKRRGGLKKGLTQPSRRGGDTLNPRMGKRKKGKGGGEMDRRELR